MLSKLLTKCETRATELLSTGSAEDSAGITRFQAELRNELLKLIAKYLPSFKILPENQSTLTKVITALSTSTLYEDPNLMMLKAYAFFFEALQKSPAKLMIFARN